MCYPAIGLKRHIFRRPFFGLLNMSLLCLVFIAQIAAASSSNIRFQRYSLEQGLSQEAVFSMLQDSTGFMWFGTQEGLNRFDGYQFRTFHHDPDDINSLAGDAVYAMIEDHRGKLWLGTDGGGLNHFDPKTETFSRFNKSSHGLSSDRINVIFEDQNRVLWVGTYNGGLNRFDENTQTFESFRHDKADPKSLNHDNVRAIHQDHRGRLWVGTDQGISLFDPAGKRFNSFNGYESAPQALKTNSIRSIFSDRQNRLWVGTHENGLIRIDGDRQYLQFRHEPDNNASLCHNRVRDIFEDNKGLLWVATDDGLCLWQPASGNFVRYRHDPQDLYSIGDNRTLSLYQDKGGVLWLGTFGGLNKWSATGFVHFRQDSSSGNALSSNIITAFEQSHDGDIWVGSYDGLNRFNRETNTFTTMKSEPGQQHSLSDNRIMSLFTDADGSLWIGTRGKGLDHFDPVSGQFRHYRHDENTPHSLSADGITDILADNHGSLWVGTYGGGLNRFNRESGTFEHFRHRDGDSDSLSTDRILTLHQSRDGSLWIGTEGGGLNRLDISTGKFTRYRHQSGDSKSLSNDTPLSILEDRGGDLWVGTWGGGLNRWRAEDRLAGQVRFKRYGKKQGFLSSVIYDIVADGQGDLWLSTNRGLTRFDPVAEQVTSYDVSHGLQDNEFNHNAAFISDDGQLFFGGSQGFNAFYAEDIGANSHRPPVVLTGLLKLNQKTAAGDALLAIDNLEFDYKDYVVAFEFSGLDFNAPQKNRYQYKLEGFDENWIDIGNTRRTTFTNLPAGNYVFRVKASNNDGVWNEEGLALKLKVTPAPWKSWWAYSSYALLVFSLLSAYIRAHLRKLAEKAEYSRHLENQVKLRTAELTEANRALAEAKEAAESGNRAKGAFIATMSHELRTPMTSIIGFAESILEDAVNPEEGKRRIHKIIRNANHLLQLMNNVLDISKIEVKHLELEQILVSVPRLLQELEELIGQRATEKQLSLVTNYHFPIPAWIQGDPTRLKQILLNLCGNAIKFTEKGGISIDVRAEQAANQLHFTVTDTGIGIAKDKQETVFEAFSQADSSTTRKFGGTGLGLSISRQLAEAMGGEMTLTSEEGVGSEFAFFIDMGEAQPETWLDNQQAIDEILAQATSSEFTVPRLAGHILLAEDWPDNQELIRMYVERTGVKITLVENGQLAVESALVNDFDMILMDVQMPEVDGIEATRILRATGFSKPIVALTANVSKADIDTYLACGFSGHLSKPIERERFYKTLADILPAASTDSRPAAEAEAGLAQKDQQLLENFLARLPQMMSEIRQAAQQQDWQTLAGLMHNLKGLGGSFGFPELTERAAPVYDSIAKKQYDDALAKLEQLQQTAAAISQ